MTQSELNREVARVTGESVGFIRNFGFCEVRVPSAPDWTGKGSRIAIRARKAYRRVRPQQQQVLKAA
jgi:hypothetical protein